MPLYSGATIHGNTIRKSLVPLDLTRPGGKTARLMVVFQSPQDRQQAQRIQVPAWDAF